MKHGAILLLIAGLLLSAGAVQAAKGVLAMKPLTSERWAFSGEIGRRVDVNIEQWLLRAPEANPGLLDMFRRADRRLPAEPLVPWAGEFAGKYLISAAQACRMSNDPRLMPYVQEFVDALVACQAPNGYLGPFPKPDQLLGNWDLWNHHHVMTGLLMWYDLTGDRQAFDAAVRAANLICDIYGGGERRPIEAGAPECNLAVLKVMLDLFRRTDDPRYLELTRRIEEDMEQAGDWLREGARGTPYCVLPNNGTRWESLHIVQAFADLFELTGKPIYRDAAVRLWESVRNRDRHPSGAFATHERAFGSPYEEGSIETCCSIAWAALSIDVLRLTGDSRVADELELTTWNQFLAAQHPSGSWCTYDNPINGVRVPAFHTIVFQARPGSPELNCCSVNAPRGLGMLPEWALMADAGGLTVNFYGPMETTVALEKGGKVAIRQDTAYPLDGRIKIAVSPAKKTAFTLRLRIPEWSRTATVSVNGEAIGAVEPGAYVPIERTWKKGDSVELSLDMSLRYWAGDGHRKGRAALYTGPLLLAFDAGHNPYETAALEPIDLATASLRPAPVGDSPVPPLGLWEIAGADPPVVLCDFATAGARGTDYAAWLPVVNAGPPPIWLETPPNGATAAPGSMHFAWTSFGPAENGYELMVARDPSFREPLVHLTGLTKAEAEVADAFTEDGTYYWRVSTQNAHGRQDSRPRDGHFIIDTAAAGQHPLPEATKRAEFVDPFGVPEGGYILGVAAQDVSFDKERWLLYDSRFSIDGAGYFSPAKDEDTSFVWSLKEIPAGTYQIDAWIPLDPNADHASNAAYRIHHASGDATVEVNLTNSTLRWQSLGEFTLDAASRIEVSNQGDRYVVVEGIRLTPVTK